ncbi:MAG: hypothetical protein ACREDO_11265 [Methyloceanibacter sp.]
MRKVALGLAALFAVALAGPALAGSVHDEIQDEEQPGSEIEMDIGPGGNVEIREKKMKSMEAEGENELQPLDDPDAPVGGDPIDDELPGEGPEDLSGPEDEDPLPE